MTQKGSSDITAWSVAKRLCFRRQGKAMACLGIAITLLAVAPVWARADQVEMQNGDRYVGSVLSLSADTLVLQNEVLGTVQLPRGKVAHIRLGSGPLAGAPALPSSSTPKARPPSASVAGPAAGTNSPLAFPELSGHTNLIRQIQKQFLAGAGPEANQKFDELLSGLMSGKLTVDDLRAQAQSAADQLRAMKRDGGQDPGFATDTYLTILDQFLKETAPSGSATNAMVPPSAAKPDAAQPED
jgi:hypothetical protein